MIKRLKRLIMRCLLTKHQRIVIWNALWFSNYTYRRRGNLDGAVETQGVMENVMFILGIKKQTYTYEEVNEIVNNTVKEQEQKLAKKNETNRPIKIIKFQNCSDNDELDNLIMSAVSDLKAKRKNKDEKTSSEDGNIEVGLPTDGAPSQSVPSDETSTDETSTVGEMGQSIPNHDEDDGVVYKE